MGSLQMIRKKSERRMRKDRRRMIEDGKKRKNHNAKKFSKDDMLSQTDNTRQGRKYKTRSSFLISTKRQTPR